MSFQSGHLEGWYGLDMFYAHRPHQRLELNLRSCLSLQGATRAGVLLVTGHASHSVIHDDCDHLAAVVHRVDQCRDTGVEEGRIADDCHVPLGAAGFDCPVRHRNACPHAPAGMDGTERWDEPQCVTADIAIHRHFEFVQHVERPAVRATRAEYWWAGRQRSNIHLWQRDMG